MSPEALREIQEELRMYGRAGDPGRTWVEADGETFGARPDVRGPIGGTEGYGRIVPEGTLCVRGLDELIEALAEARDGDVVFVPGEVEIDCTTRVHIEVLRTVAAPRGTVDRLAWSPTGELVAAGGDGGGVQLWDARTWKPVRRMEQPGEIWSIAFSADGHLLATGAHDAGGAGRQAPHVPRRVHGGGILPVRRRADRRKMRAAGAHSALGAGAVTVTDGSTALAAVKASSPAPQLGKIRMAGVEATLHVPFPCHPLPPGIRSGRRGVPDRLPSVVRGHTIRGSESSLQASGRRPQSHVAGMDHLRCGSRISHTGEWPAHLWS